MQTLVEVVDSFFSGSAEALASQLLANRAVSDAELKAIRTDLERTLKSRKVAKRLSRQ
ncbi:MAG: hypothetical protein VX893_16760 [Candidatus Latescibacterota bacterium]|nr:hypothetical protein [Candidatus Latescibacterota bacterium]